MTAQARVNLWLREEGPWQGILDGGTWVMVSTGRWRREHGTDHCLEGDEQIRLVLLQLRQSTVRFLFWVGSRPWTAADVTIEMLICATYVALFAAWGMVVQGWMGQ